MPKELSPKQQTFCREYLVDFNATQAAVRAGYSAKTCKQIGSRLLSYVDVQHFIKALQGEQTERLNLNGDMILRELMRIAFSDLGHAFDKDGNIVPLPDMPEDMRKAVAGFEVVEYFEGQGRDRQRMGNTKKLKNWDKVKALELLGKHYKLWTDKVEHSGKLSLEELVLGSLEKSE